MEDMSESVRDKIRDNPSSWKCCHCSAEMQKRMGVTGSGALHKGLIVICSTCSKVNVLGDSELHPMTKEEFFALDKPTQRAIFMTAKGIKQLVKTGGSWNPYSNQ